MNEPATLPQHLLRHATEIPRRVAFRERRRGIWKPLSWSGYANLVRRIAAGVATQGFGPGGRLAVLGENRPQLYAAMLAAQALGGAGVPLHPDAESARIIHILRDCHASVLITEETTQAEMVLAARDRLPDLADVIALSDLGRLTADRPDFPTSALAACTPTDIALLLFPWKPDKLPRPVVLTHANLLAAACRITEREEVRPSDEAFAYLPLASLEDVIYSQALALTVGCVCNCPEGPDTIRRDLREIGPTILIAPARLLELLADEFDSRAAAASPLKRALLRRFIVFAEAAEQRRDAGSGLPLRLAIASLIGELLVCAPVRDQLGLARLRWVHLGNGPLAPTLAQRFRAWCATATGYRQHDRRRPRGGAGVCLTGPSP